VVYILKNTGYDVLQNLKVTGAADKVMVVILV